MRRHWLAAAFLLGLAVPLLPTSPAQAHPLGNFTTNQYAGLRVTADGIDVNYVLDLAELPAYQTTIANKLRDVHELTVEDGVLFALVAWQLKLASVVVVEQEQLAVRRHHA